MKTIKNLAIVALVILVLSLVCNGSDKEMLIERSADLELKVNNYCDIHEDEEARSYFIDLLESDSLDHEQLDEIEKEFNSYKSRH